MTDRLSPLGAGRRALLKGGAGVLAMAATSGPLGVMAGSALAQGGLRAELLQIPGVGRGSPTDADWQRVGTMCLGGTRATVAEGEFAGVELTFMGLNHQTQHNALYRGLLRPWEAYTGAEINWIDLAQADYEARLQQTIASGAVDFDLMAMGAPFEGDVCGRGLASEVPGWVADLVEMDDYVTSLKPPVGTWKGRTYRLSVDGDAHTFAYRRDIFSDPTLAEAWKAEGRDGEWRVPTTWQMVQGATKFLDGKELNGVPLHGYLDPLKPWGGFGFYFLASRATAYAKHPDDPAWLFDADTMRPRIDNPAFVRAIQDVLDVMEAQPEGQIDADPNTIAFQQFLTGTGAALSWWGDVGAAVRTPGNSAVGGMTGFSILPGSDDVWNHRAGQWEKLPTGPNFAPNCAYLGWGIYVTARVDGDAARHKAAWSAAAHLGGKDLSLWTVAYVSGLQPYRNSHFDYAEWEAAGFERAFIEDYLGANLESYTHPNAAIEPRIPGIFRYYAAAEEELARIYAGAFTAQQGAENIVAAWERITDEIGREGQIAVYRASLGLP